MNCQMNMVSALKLIYVCLSNSTGKIPSDQPELYTLDGQVKHKIKFIDTYVLTDVNVHFIGHSTGAKICIQLVKQYCKIHKAVAYLLFPTLARIAKTPNGWKLWPIAGPLRKLFVIAANLLNRLKESHNNVQFFKTFPGFNSFSRCTGSTGNKLSSENSTTSASGTPAIVPVNVRTSMSLLNPQALERSLFLARDQLKMVDELNAKDIRLHSDRLVLYFGTNDRWCPLEYCHNLLRQVPKARAIICPHEFEHAFVLQSSQQMATIVSEWIKEFS
ncbi:lipid droplet-associated hydrolase-like [Daphnia carinata]|uniref:lipid droplet-associated hydrolase-like n=1 Tax=Daphnia carinata TaxID=120202 RepID=UPI002868FAD0|nr:lipid droplet-associated hydrolase-like [Daphnia carinata]